MENKIISLNLFPLFLRIIVDKKYIVTEMSITDISYYIIQAGKHMYIKCGKRSLNYINLK